MRTVLINGFEAGFALFTILSMLIVFFGLPSNCLKKLMCMPIKKKERKEPKQELFQDYLQIRCTKDLIEDKKILTLEKLVTRMSLEELRNATNNFNKDNIVGVGRMGKIYKTTLTNGWSIAIKRLHDWHGFDRFLAELLTLGRIRHRNVVPLLGFCLELTETLLVYTYMSNGNLHDWLHTSTKPIHEPQTTMSWSLRLKIAEGIARGLAWLHHNGIFQVAHLNLSSRCILLDQNLEPKISNFEDAKFLVNQTGNASISNLSLLVNGKIPDYDSFKEDVYRFGIVLLELITGKEPHRMGNVSEFSRNILEQVTHLRSGQYDGKQEILTGDEYDEVVMFDLMRIASDCTKTPADQRPTMLQIYQSIQGMKCRV